MSSQSSEQSSWLRDYTFAQWLCQLPALSFIVIIRRDIGYRLLNPLALAGVNAFLVIVGLLAMQDSPKAGGEGLVWFATFSLAFGASRRRQCRREFKRNEVRQHSYYIGSSPFDFKWLPNFIRRNRKIARIIDPIFCILLGLMMIHVSPMLTVWLLFTGICLRALEDDVHRREKERELDLIDSLIESQHQAQIVDKFDYIPVQPKQSKPGITTGIGKDIEGKIRRLKTETRSCRNN